MTYIKGFKGFKSLLENTTYADFARSIVINEAAKDLASSEIYPAVKIKSIGAYGKMQKRFEVALELIRERKATEEVSDALTKCEELLRLDKDLFSSFFKTTGKNAEILLALFVISYAGKYDIKIKEAMNRVGNFDIQRTKNMDIKFTPNAANTGVFTVGQVRANSVEVREPKKQSSTGLDRLKKYINSVNMLGSWALNGNEGYGPNCIDENGYFDLDTFDEDYTADLTYLYIDRDLTLSQVARKEDTKTDLVGYEPLTTGLVDIKFAQGKSIIPDGEMHKVDALVETVLRSFKNKKVDLFKLTSSASPEWGELKTLADYGNKALKGTKATLPKAGDSYSKNATLAYNRGVALMKVLNSKLQAKGHSGFPKFQVNWQIADKGGPAGNGRFVDLHLEINGKAGKEITTTTVSGDVKKEGTSISGAKNKTLYCYEVSF